MRIETIGNATLYLGDCRRIEQAYKQRPLFEAEPAPQPVQLGLEVS